MEDACKWAERNLPSVHPYNKLELEQELIAEGRAMISELNGGEKGCVEDVVIFDADKWIPDEDGYIDW